MPEITSLREACSSRIFSVVCGTDSSHNYDAGMCTTFQMSHIMIDYLRILAPTDRIARSHWFLFKLIIASQKKQLIECSLVCPRV